VSISPHGILGRPAGKPRFSPEGFPDPRADRRKSGILSLGEHGIGETWGGRGMLVCLVGLSTPRPNVRTDDSEGHVGGLGPPFVIAARTHREPGGFSAN
jgi:hypothetical protein